MKKVIGICFITFLVWMSIGAFLIQTVHPKGHFVMGSGVFFLFFILMPLFIYYRYKDGKYKKYQINDEMFLQKKENNTKILHSIYDFTSDNDTYLTIGTFDGVHIGHQKIIKKLIKDAKKAGKKSMLLTFFPHPRMILKQDNEIKLIQTIEERAIALKKMGLDYIVIHPFDMEFANISAEDFISDIFVEQLNTSKLIIGYDHHFGKNREGNIETLNTYASEYNYEVEIISVQDVDEVSVSSTKIRKAITNGDIETANKYINANYTISGIVVKGKQLGRTIGFPTANIAINKDYKLLPKTGVYVVKTYLQNNVFFGMMNIGKRPTVNGKNQTIEVHLFDFDANLYGKEICVEVLHFIREEQKFDSIEDLTLQLKKDEITARSYQKEII